MNKQLTAPDSKELSILGKRSMHPTEEHPAMWYKTESFELGGSGIKETFEVSQRMRSPDSPSCALLCDGTACFRSSLKGNPKVPKKNQ